MELRVYVKSKGGNYEQAMLYDIQEGVGICFFSGEDGGSYGWQKIKLKRIVPADFIEREIQVDDKLNEHREAEKRLQRLQDQYLCTDGQQYEKRNVAIGHELQIIRAERADGSALKETVSRLEKENV